ncbi:MAG: DJ-1/PfpI family protein [Clostridiales bacterium]|nr:DJ-1/PfpI family protein [Clostridiales bacterium]
MVYLFLADGFEIVEAMAPIDMLRRAKIDVLTVGVYSKSVTSSCGINVEADVTADEFKFENVDAIILPGGAQGVINLEKSPLVQSVIDDAVCTGALIAAICAAPSILGKKGLLRGKKAICYPGFECALDGAEISSDFIVKDGDFITAKGAGVAVDFGIEIIKELIGDEAAQTVKSQIQCR